MPSKLADWLKTKQTEIVAKQDKVIFNEVVGCTLNKNFRAAYIMSWISIIESLKRKIFKFADLGDKNSEEAKKKIIGLEEKKTSADKQIYELAAKCELIENSELNTIQYLWGQRSLFAHPYEKQPDLEEVKFIIDQAVKITLGKDLSFNKSYLQEICENIVEKPYFLSQDITEIRDFSKRIISRTRERLHPFLFKTILAKIGALTKEDFLANKLVKLRFFIIEIFLNTNLKLSSPLWTLEDKITKFPFESFIGCVHSETWELIPDRPKEMLFSYFENEVNTKKRFLLTQTLSNMIPKSAISEPYLSRFISKLNNLSFSSAINFYKIPDATFERIKKEIETYNYETQGPVIDWLKTPLAIKSIVSFTPEQQLNIGRLLASAADNTHWKSKSMVSSIISDDYKYTDFVKAGIFLNSIFSFSGYLTTERGKFLTAIKNLNTLELSATSIAYGIIINNLSRFNITSYFSKEFIIDLYSKIEEKVEWKVGHKELFISLKETLLKILE